MRTLPPPSPLQAALLAVTFMLGLAVGQEPETLDPLAAPTFGAAVLDGGFDPDPFEIDLVSGGPLNAGEAIGGSCSGNVDAAPDFRFEWSGEGRDLRIFFVTGGDTTLIVNDPQGGWHCNDDFDDANPLIAFPASLAGQYAIWVGSFDPSELLFGRLFVTEQPLSPPAFSGDSGSLDITAAPNFGSVTLAVGFTPDPHSVEILSGGGVDVFADLGDTSCSGFATAEPDLSLEWGAGGRLLRILVVGEGDTTLIVNDPQGGWHCNDDFSGIDPLIEFVNPETGRYHIWVGSFVSSSLIPAVLYLTEREMGPSDF